MFFLFLAIICSASIALIFKYSEGNNLNRYVVTSFNYLTASIICLILILQSNLEFYSFSLAIDSFINEFNVVFSNNILFSPEATLIWALFIGILAGIFFFLSFLYYQISVNKNGASLSGMTAKLGILVPLLLSIILFGEFPTSVQVIGILLALGSIIISNYNPELKGSFQINTVLLFLFILGGFAEFSNKIFQQYGIADYKNVFLFFVFSTACIISTVFALKKNPSISRRDILTGIAVGIPNLFSSFFLISALNSLPAFIVFPAYSATSIIFIMFGEFIIFKERLSRKNYFAAGITIISLIFLNL